MPRKQHSLRIYRSDQDVLKRLASKFNSTISDTLAQAVESFAYHELVYHMELAPPPELYTFNKPPANYKGEPNYVMIIKTRDKETIEFISNAHKSFKVIIPQIIHVIVRQYLIALKANQ